MTAKSKNKRRKRQPNGTGRKRSARLYTAHRPEDIELWRRRARARGVSLTRLIELAMRRYFKDDGLPDQLSLDAELTLNGVVYLLRGEATRDEAKTRAKGRGKKPKRKPKAVLASSILCTVCGTSYSTRYCPRCGTERGKQ